jgi:hypothetical protein
VQAAVAGLHRQHLGLQHRDDEVACAPQRVRPRGRWQQQHMPSQRAPERPEKPVGWPTWVLAKTGNVGVERCRRITMLRILLTALVRLASAILNPSHPPHSTRATTQNPHSERERER